MNDEPTPEFTAMTAALAEAFRRLEPVVRAAWDALRPFLPEPARPPSPLMRRYRAKRRFR